MKLSSMIYSLAPLTLAILELFHPRLNRTAEGVAGFLPLVNGAYVWILVHLLQLVLFPLSALMLVLLLPPGYSLPKFIAQIALGLFAVCYVAFDAIAGLSTVMIAQLSLIPEPGIRGEIIKAILSHPLVMAISMTGNVAWIFGSLLVALSWWRMGHGFLPAVLLSFSGPALVLSHGPPFGPLCFGLVGVGIAIHISRLQLKTEDLTIFTAKPW